LEGSAASLESRVLVSVIKPASAPTAVKAVDAWTASAKTTAKVKLTWVAPKSLYGAKLSGFQVDRKVGSGAWFNVSSSISAAARSVVFSYPNEAGQKMYFRVRAVTKVGAIAKAGTNSATVSVTPTAMPKQPVFAGYVANDIRRPQWLAQSISERGGLPTTYTASAGTQNLTCTTVANSCNLSAMQNHVDYTITITATNARGTSTTETALTPGDSYFNQQWYLYTKYGVNAPKAWANSEGSSSVVVAVLDTGITSHSDLNPNVLPGYDFVSNGSFDSNGDPGDYKRSDPTSTSSWHGTHVAGLVAATANNAGVIGVAPGVSILPVRIMGSSGGSQSDLIAGIIWAAGLNDALPNFNPAKVINISMGSAADIPCGTADLPSPTYTAVQAAVAHGVTVVISAGNGDVNNEPKTAATSFPGNCPGAINVGATGVEGAAAYYSNFGPVVDISAPGGDYAEDQNGNPIGQLEGATVDSQGMLLSTFNQGLRDPGAETYVFDQGTSMAAPIVAGVVALVLSAKPNLTPAQVLEVIQASARPFKPGSSCAITLGTSNQRCGAGIVDAAAAVAYATSHY
jgi:serine protease